MRRRSTLSPSYTGAPGLAGLVIGVLAIVWGSVGWGVFCVILGTAMVFFAYRQHRREGRW